jgi:hypothetical protein
MSPRRYIDEDEFSEDGETYGSYLRKRLDRIRQDYASGLLLTVEEMRVLDAEAERGRDPDFEDSSMRSLFGGYQAQIKKMDDGQFYWHLYRQGTRVNGGLAGTWTGAMRAARGGVASNDRSNFL